MFYWWFFLGSFKALAGVCEEVFFDAQSFVAVAQKRALLKGPEWDIYNLRDLNRYTSHWSREEAEAFFNFFIRRIGKETLKIRLSHKKDWAFIEFNDFMEKKRFYDSLSTDIVPSALKHSFVGFRVTDHTQHIKNIKTTMQKLVGKKAFVYLLKTGFLDLFLQADSLKETLAFVLDYTTKHKTDIDSLKRRIKFIRLFENVQLIELKELFSILDVSALELYWQKIREEQTSSLSLHQQKMGLFLASFRSLIEAVAQVPVNELKDTVKMLETFITPKEISHMMTQAFIFKARAPQLKESIEILHNTYNTKAQLTERQFKYLINNLNHQLVQWPILDMAKPPQQDFPSFIRFLIKQHAESILSVEEPARLKKLIKILNQEMGKGLLAVTFQNFNKNWVVDYFWKGFFSIELSHLQQMVLGFFGIRLDPRITKGLVFKVRHSFFYSRPSALGFLIWRHFNQMVHIEEMGDFIKTLKIIQKHIRPKKIKIAEQEKIIPSRIVFTVQLIDLIQVSDKLSFSEALADMLYLDRAFYRQMPQMLTEKSVLELLPSFYKKKVERDNIYQELGLENTEEAHHVDSLFADAFGSP